MTRIILTISWVVAIFKRDVYKIALRHADLIIKKWK
jgi:hypothetical protein